MKLIKLTRHSLRNSFPVYINPQNFVSIQAENGFTGEPTGLRTVHNDKILVKEDLETVSKLLGGEEDV